MCTLDVNSGISDSHNCVRAETMLHDPVITWHEVKKLGEYACKRDVSCLSLQIAEVLVR